MQVYFFERCSAMCAMHSTSNKIKFTPYSDVNEVIDELYESPRSIYQGYLETSMRGSYFIFDSVQLMYCKYHEVNFRSGGSYTDSPDIHPHVFNSFHRTVQHRESHGDFTCLSSSNGVLPHFTLEPLSSVLYPLFIP